VLRGAIPAIGPLRLDGDVINLLCLLLSRIVHAIALALRLDEDHLWEPKRIEIAAPRRQIAAQNARGCIGSCDRPPPLDRHDGSSPRSASAASKRQLAHLGLRAQPEPYQKLRRQQRHVRAGGAIDLDEIATPEILDPRQVKGLHFGLCSRNVLRTLAGFVNGDRI
jgi:hypothetical protein